MTPARRDLAAGIAGGGLAAAGALAAGVAGPASLAAAATIGVVLAIARAAPRVAWVVGAVLTLATIPGWLLPGGDALIHLPLLGVVGFIGARFDEGRAGVVGLVVVVALAVVTPVVGEDNLVPFPMTALAAWGAGRALRDRALVASELAVRVRELDAERDAYVALSVRYERARIASELHDIVAHAISVMVVQAGAGQRLVGRDDSAAAETFEVIADAARQAESEIGRLVHLLTDVRTDAEASDLVIVEELVGRAAASGLAVTLTLAGDRDGLSPAAAQLAYRVVREGLTNALRHSPGADVAVRVEGRPGAVEVEVLSGPARGESALGGAGGGTGIGGLRDRVEDEGGTLEAGPDPAGGWRLAARVPRGMLPVAPDERADAAVGPGRR